MVNEIGAPRSESKSAGRGLSRFEREEASEDSEYQVGQEAEGGNDMMEQSESVGPMFGEETAAPLTTRFTASILNCRSSGFRFFSVSICSFIRHEVTGFSHCLQRRYLVLSK